VVAPPPLESDCDETGKLSAVAHPRLVVPLSFVGRDEYDTFKSIVRLYGLEKAIEIVKGFRKHQREHPNAYSEGEYAAFSESNFNLEAAIASNSKTSMTEVPE
jgi:hypothetical protein